MTLDEAQRIGKAVCQTGDCVESEWSIECLNREFVDAPFRWVFESGEENEHHYCRVELKLTDAWITAWEGWQAAVQIFKDYGCGDPHFAEKLKGLVKVQNECFSKITVKQRFELFNEANTGWHSCKTQTGKCYFNDN